MAIPGLYFLYRFPSLYTNLAFSGNIFNTILGNVVSISIYTFPILLLNFLYSDFKIFNLKKVIYYSAISLSIFILIVFNYNIDSMGANGGIFFIGSKLIFGNYFLFYLLFLINFTVILIIFSDKYDLLILFSILIVSSGFITLQKYLEPLWAAPLIKSKCIGWSQVQRSWTAGRIEDLITWSSRCKLVLK